MGGAAPGIGGGILLTRLPEELVGDVGENSEPGMGGGERAAVATGGSGGGARVSSALGVSSTPPDSSSSDTEPSLGDLCPEVRGRDSLGTGGAAGRDPGTGGAPAGSRAGTFSN